MRAMLPRIPSRLLLALPVLVLTVLLVSPGASAQAPEVSISPRSETVTSSTLSVTIHWCGAEGYDPDTRSIKLNGVEMVDNFSTTSDDPTCGVDAVAEVSTGTITLRQGSNSLYATIYNGGYEGADLVTYTFTPPYRVSVVPDSRWVYTEAQRPGTETFTVTNTGGASATYRLTVSQCQSPLSSCHASDSTVTLAPNAYKAVSVSFQAGAPAISDLDLVATDKSHSTSTDEGSFFVSVHSHAVAVTPDSATANPGIGDPDKLSFKVHNVGDSAAVYTLTATCTGAASCSFPATSVTLSAGATTTAWVNYSVSGEGSPGTVQLKATYTSNTSVWAQGTTSITARAGCNSSITVGPPMS